MAKIDAIDVPKLLFTEGAAPSTPAAAKVYAYAKADGLLYSKDDAGVETLMSSGASAGGAMATDALWDAAGDLAVGTGANTGHKLTAGSANARLVSAGAADPVWTVFPRALNRLTSGDVTITATTNVFASNVTGLGDLTLAAVTGDYIEVGVSAIAPNTTAQSMKFDVCTVVAGAAANFISNATATGSTNGLSQWYCTASVIAKAAGSVLYVAQAGDLSGGNIVLRLTCFVSASRVVGATANQPLTFWARNIRQ